MSNIFSDWLEIYFDEVTPVEFYRDIFPPGELQAKGEYTKGKYTGIIVAVTKEKKKNGNQARQLLKVISEVRGNYDNAVLNKYLDTLHVHIIYALGCNVLNCLE